MASLLMRGALARHPQLRVAFLEANCGWLPYWMWRIEEHIHEWSVGRSPSASPREIFDRQCFLSLEPGESCSIPMVEERGGENLLFSTDYPHNDSRYPHATETFLELPISDRCKRAILWDNPLRLYGFQPSDFPPA